MMLSLKIKQKSNTLHYLLTKSFLGQFFTPRIRITTYADPDHCEVVPYRHQTLIANTGTGTNSEHFFLTKNLFQIIAHHFY